MDFPREIVHKLLHQDFGSQDARQGHLIFGPNSPFRLEFAH